MDFSGKVVVITGASSGIGAGAAEYLAQFNASVVLVGRNGDRLKNAHIKCANRENHLSIIADVTDANDRENIINKALEKFGRIDVLINNAGIAREGEVEGFSMDEFDEVFDINVKSAFALTQLTIPHLIKSKGNIVNISSVSGTRAVIGRTCYGMSKAALDHFTRCLALELAPDGIRVNSVNPAVIKTDFERNMGMNEAQYEQFVKSACKTNLFGRCGKVDEVAKSIGFLASNEMSSFITGAVLAVDAGKAIMCPT